VKTPSQSLLIRIFLLGLPIGILLLGTISILWSETIAPDEKPTNSSVRPVREGGPRLIAKHELITHVDTLSRRIGERHTDAWENLEAARFYLTSTLGERNIGYTVREQSYTVDGKTYTNLECQIKGTKWPDELVVVGAHYDTLPGTPGADDNASGVAALITLAKAFVSSPQDRTIRFVAFVNEEPPWFHSSNMGSYRYADSLKQANAKVHAMISLESLGYYSDAPNSQQYPPKLAQNYPDTGNFLAIISNPANKGLVEFAYDSASQAQKIPVEQGVFPEGLPGVAWSDHWSFWQFGYPALMVTDTALFRNPHYHKASDKPDQIDFERLHQATETMRHLLLDLANMPEGASFK